MRSKGAALLLTVSLVVIVLLGVRAAMRNSSAAVAPKSGPPPVPAILGLSRAQTVPVYLNGIGNVLPLASVTIKVRVDGQLERVGFVEGQDVKAGDLLARIDPRPYQAVLENAQATKARDEAQLANAQVDEERYQVLVKQDSIQKQTYDTQVALVRQLRATVQSDQAQIDAAQVNLDYTTIRSPISGRTGVRLIDPGNIVHASDATGLVVVNQIDPIAVLFTLPEGDFQRVNRAIQQGGRERLTVRALSRESAELLATGKLLLVNNQIDTTTGTVQLKATFPNAIHVLWPGEYVNVQLLLGERDAVTVPASVVQRGPQGLYAYVVNNDDSVSMQTIKVASVQDGIAVLDEGLAAGTRVVVDGQYKLKPGSKVTKASSTSGTAPGAATASSTTGTAPGGATASAPAAATGSAGPPSGATASAGAAGGEGR
jgi:multidrug efflux system membrane fusion protein